MLNTSKCFQGITVAAGTKFNQIILYKRFMPVFQQIKCKQASPQVCVFHCRKPPDTSLYFTCKNEFRDAFHDSPMPNNSTVSALMSCFCDTSMQDRKWSG